MNKQIWVNNVEGRETCNYCQRKRRVFEDSNTYGNWSCYECWEAKNIEEDIREPTLEERVTELEDQVESLVRITAMLNIKPRVKY